MSAEAAPPYHGLHPTRDTLPVVYNRTLGRAGDALRQTLQVAQVGDSYE